MSYAKDGTSKFGFTSSFLDCASALALSRLTQAWIFASSLLQASIWEGSGRMERSVRIRSPALLNPRQDLLLLLAMNFLQQDVQEKM